jgi:hypothetical protein
MSPRWQQAFAEAPAGKPAERRRLLSRARIRYSVTAIVPRDVPSSFAICASL